MQRAGGAVEHSPWVAERAWERRPFAGVDELAAAMRGVILSASREEQLQLLRAHPELAGREAAAGTMTTESTGEQGRLGLLSLSADRAARLQSLNRRYRERFGIPLIVALRLHDSLDSVFAAAEGRLAHDPAAEWAIALEQVCAVMRGRLDRLFAAGDPASPPAKRA